jgi:hypothetical protein
MKTKRFIDNSAIFEIEVPITWKYSLVDSHVHTFEGFQLTSFDCFQFSINKVKSKEEKHEYAHLLGFLPSKVINGMDFRSYPDEEHEGGLYVTKVWATIIGDDIILFNLTYYNAPSEEPNEQLNDNELEMVYAAMGSFQFIDEDIKQPTLNSYRFEMFLQGIGATVIILGKAIENKAFIEATCLLASQIDSLLRVAIVLKRQLINNNDIIELEWIYQGASDKKKSEKDIYKKAKEFDIIDSDVYDELFALYEDRNRVIHRFIISEITLAEVETISYKYYGVREKIKLIVDDIESEQIRLNVGMTTQDEDNPGNKSPHLKSAIGKIGKLDYYDEKEV